MGLGRRKVRRVLFKFRFLGLVLLAMLAAVWPVASQAATPSAPSLGAAATFAVLSAPVSGGAVTCTGGSISGDVGSSGARASVVQTGCPISGAIVAPVSTQVVNDFNTAYAAYASIPCSSNLTGTLASVTLAPGVYCVDAVAKTGTLTLSGPASGVWIFKVAAVPATTPPTGALTGTGFTVVMAGGGNPCNVNWQVAEAATMTNSNLVGTILAGAAITLTDTVLAGRALAKAGVTTTRSNIAGCTAAGGLPVTTKCLAARQALTEATAQDVTEDASEPAPAKTGENDSSDKSKDEGQAEKDAQKASDADKKEDKAETAHLRSLEQAVRKACGSDQEGKSGDEQGSEQEKDD
jgi:Ice-binding-like